METLIKIPISIGAIWIALFGSKILRVIYIYSPSSLLRYHHSHRGRAPWAVITGASDGMGKGYAREPAHRGFNVVLHGRNLTNLDSVKKELSEEFANVNFRTIVVDASKSGSDSNNRSTPLWTA
ncbi:hypothetical protein V1506DRAFT_138038 [Lipomyces tetrasporus]